MYEKHRFKQFVEVTKIGFIHIERYSLQIKVSTELRLALRCPLVIKIRFFRLSFHDRKFV
jgi:hypothetical protein